MGFLPNGVAVFLFNHGRDARATLGTAVFASEAPAVKRMRKPVGDRFYMETGAEPVGDWFYMGTGGGRKVAWAACPMGLRFFSLITGGTPVPRWGQRSSQAKPLRLSGLRKPVGDRFYIGMGNRKPVGDRFYIGNGWRQKSGMGILLNGVAVFLV